MDLETIRARLVGDSTQFVAAFDRAERAVGGRGGTGGLSGAAMHSNRALNTLKGGMVSLAAQATGTSGPIAKLASGLLMFGGGSTLILGVAAGIGAISLAYRALTNDTRESEAAQKDLIKALEGVGVHAQLTAARIKLSEAREALGKAATSEQGFFRRIFDVFQPGAEVERQQAAARDLAKAEMAV